MLTGHFDRGPVGCYFDPGMALYFRRQVEQYGRSGQAKIQKKRQDDILWQENVEKGWFFV